MFHRMSRGTGFGNSQHSIFLLEDGCAVIRLIIDLQRAIPPGGDIQTVHQNIIRSLIYDINVSIAAQHPNLTMTGIHHV